MAKSLGAYRGYGCMYEVRGQGNCHFNLTFYRFGYKFDVAFERYVTAFEYNLPYVSRQVIDQIIAVKREERYPDLPDNTVPTYLKQLPR